MAELSLTVLSLGMHWSWHVGVKTAPLTVSCPVQGFLQHVCIDI